MVRFVFGGVLSDRRSALLEDAQGQQIEVCTTVHLSLDELEPMDVPFHLTLIPKQLEGCEIALSDEPENSLASFAVADTSGEAS